VKLTEEQAKALAELEELRDAPDEEPAGNGVSRVLNVTVDLGDEAQVERAIKLGFLTAPAAEAEPEPEAEGDEPPKRGGYFPPNG
jgi:hypothetical protein